MQMMTKTPKAQDGMIDLQATRYMVAASKRKVLLFCHMHKTGGTTIEKMLLETYQGSSHRVSTPNELNDFKKSVEEGLLDADGTYLVFGHRAHVALDFLSERIDTFPFTIIRRPLSLFESNFSFQHTRQGNVSLTTSDYLKQYPLNRIMSFFGARQFPRAVKNARRDYLVVGITERLEETAAILSYVFDLPPRPYQSRNVTSPRNYVEMDFDCVVDFLQENEEDRLIYDYFDSVHTRVYRQLLKVSDTPIVSLETGAGTFNRPIQINENLDSNGDKFSLFITGQSIWESDPKRAEAFFDKAFSLDWGMGDRILKFLKAANADKAVAWAQRQDSQLDGAESEEVETIRKRLRKWAAE